MTALITASLDLVDPRCSLCIRPALYAEREPAPDQQSPGVYVCDLHKAEGKRWAELPGAKVVREAMGVISKEARMKESAGVCPTCNGPLSREGSRYFCDECRTHAKCKREECPNEEWRIGGYCSVDCVDLAEVEEERDDLLVQAGALSNRVVDLEKERDDLRALVAKSDAERAALCDRIVELSKEVEATNACLDAERLRRKQVEVLGNELCRMNDRLERALVCEENSAEEYFWEWKQAEALVNLAMSEGRAECGRLRAAIDELKQCGLSERAMKVDLPVPSREPTYEEIQDARYWLMDARLDEVTGGVAAIRIARDRICAVDKAKATP